LSWDDVIFDPVFPQSTGKNLNERDFQMVRQLVVMLIVVSAVAWGGDVKNVDLTIEGMHCPRCVEKVKSALLKISDVKEVAVDLKKGSAKIALASSSSTSTEVLAKAVADAGYSASYKVGDETKSLTAASKSDECETKDGHHAKMDCTDDAKSGCCMEKGMKTKEVKRK
jgi:copper chaperone CopZ